METNLDKLSISELTTACRYLENSVMSWDQRQTFIGDLLEVEKQAKAFPNHVVARYFNELMQMYPQTNRVLDNIDLTPLELWANKIHVSNGRSTTVAQFNLLLNSLIRSMGALREDNDMYSHARTICNIRINEHTIINEEWQDIIASLKLVVEGHERLEDVYPNWSLPLSNDNWQEALLALAVYCDCLNSLEPVPDTGIYVQSYTQEEQRLIQYGINLVASCARLDRLISEMENMQDKYGVLSRLNSQDVEDLQVIREAYTSNLLSSEVMENFIYLRNQVLSIGSK